MKNTMITFLFFMAFSGIIHAQISKIDQVIDQIKHADGSLLAESFNSSIDLSLPSEENLYSKKQAGVIIKDFFLKNPPQSVTLVHSGSGTDGSYFAILHYLTKKSVNMRVIFYLKNYDGKYLVNELKFDIEK